MATIKMSVWNVGGGRFAIGQLGKKAAYVLKVKGSKITGQRGKRPILTEGRFERAKATAAMLAAFKTALA